MGFQEVHGIYEVLEGTSPSVQLGTYHQVNLAMFCQLENPGLSGIWLDTPDIFSWNIAHSTAGIRPQFECISGFPQPGISGPGPLSTPGHNLQHV
jgi:hypothetical protein